jgi:hypothetical protein
VKAEQQVDITLGLEVAGKLIVWAEMVMAMKGEFETELV